MASTLIKAVTVPVPATEKFSVIEACAVPVPVPMDSAVSYSALRYSWSSPVAISAEACEAAVAPLGPDSPDELPI